MAKHEHIQYLLSGYPAYRYYLFGVLVEAIDLNDLEVNGDRLLFNRTEELNKVMLGMGTFLPNLETFVHPWTLFGIKDRIALTTKLAVSAPQKATMVSIVESNGSVACVNDKEALRAPFTREFVDIFVSTTIVCTFIEHTQRKR